MNRTRTRVLTAILVFSASFALAQTSSPVAYIYVSSNDSGANNRVVGFAANASGQLTQIPGSPWADNLTYLATSGSLLFGSTNIPNDDGKNVFSYKVESNGALKYLGANNIRDDGSQNACNQAKDLLLDHTGSYLYVFVDSADCNAQEAYQSFAVNKSTGLLKYLGVTEPNAFSLGHPLTMLADNNYAYASGNGAEDAAICGFKKASNGNLVDLNSHAGSPVCNTAAIGTSGQPSDNSASIGFVAADPTNHLAASLSYSIANGKVVDNKIATIAVNTANGTQSSGSAYSNMPDTYLTTVTSVLMAPGGKLLAVGGNSGIEIFNFNPKGQATPASQLVVTPGVITAMYWDNNNHLYAISNNNSAIYVYTVTATSVQEVDGSPYLIANPIAIAGHSM